MDERTLQRKKKISYPISYKKNVLIRFKGKSTRQIALETGIPRSTIRNWCEQEAAIFDTKRSKKAKFRWTRTERNGSIFSGLFLNYMNQIAIFVFN